MKNLAPGFESSAHIPGVLGLRHHKPLRARRSGTTHGGLARRVEEGLRNVLRLSFAIRSLRLLPHYAVRVRFDQWRLRARGLVGLALIWAGPAMFVTGVLSKSINVALSAGLVVVLAPLGGWLVTGTPHSRQSAVARRVDRLQSGRLRAADVGWLLVTVIWGLGALGIPGFVREFWIQDVQTDGESITGIAEYIWAGALTGVFGYLSVSFAYLQFMGSWRRTRWGYRPPAPEVTETMPTMPTREHPGMSKARYVTTMTLLAALAFLILGASIAVTMLVNW